MDCQLENCPDPTETKENISEPSGGNVLPNDQDATKSKTAKNMKKRRYRENQKKRKTETKTQTANRPQQEEANDDSGIDEDAKDAAMEMDAAREARRVPVTVLTGFLGSGKTTLLNKILQGAHGLKIAVVENEYGEVGVDGELVLQTEETVVEMNNGCICCTVRGDLIKILKKLHKKKKFDAVIVETTGKADPGPVAQTFFIEDELAARYRLDGVVTVVDAYHIDQSLSHSREAQEQIAFADVILLNKVDLITDEERLSSLESRMKKMNAHAKIHRTTYATLDVHQVLNVGGFNVRKALQTDPEFFKPEMPYENAALFDFPKGGHYELTLHRGPDESMGVVFLHAFQTDSGSGADRSISSSAADRNERLRKRNLKQLQAIDENVAVAFLKYSASFLMSDSSNGQKERVLEAHEHSAMLAFSADHIEEVKSGGVLEAGWKRYNLQMPLKNIDADVVSDVFRFSLNVPSVGTYLLFLEHTAAEFSVQIIDDSKNEIIPHNGKWKEYAPDHEHDNSVTSVGIECLVPFDMKKLNSWLGSFLREYGNDIFRMKGVFHVQGWSRRYVFHGVHMLFSGTEDRLWKDGETRKSMLVFIGRGLDRSLITKQLYQCVYSR